MKKEIVWTSYDDMLKREAEKAKKKETKKATVKKPTGTKKTK